MAVKGDGAGTLSAPSCINAYGALWTHVKPEPAFAEAKLSA